MSIIGSNILAGAAGQGGGYTIERSVRLRSSASAYLSRTPASAGNRKTWTWSGWVKRGNLTNFIYLFDGYTDASNYARILFWSDDTLSINSYIAGATSITLNTTQVFRDVSAWYHIVVAIDTTQATSTNRVKIYVNGNQVTAFNTATYPAQNDEGSINAAVPHDLGRASTGVYYLDGYLTDVNFIDGQALTPSSFGSYNEDTGVWQPAKYIGAYGTNGFYLPFSDNTTTTTLAADVSGNGNDWTPNNISLTSGATYDSMTDTPTPYADGGNYAVLNPLDTATNMQASLANGNLELNANTASGGSGSSRATIAVNSGKWYFEATLSGYVGSSSLRAGWDFAIAGVGTGSSGITGAYKEASSNQTVIIAVDLTNLLAWVGSNGTWDAGNPSAGTGGTSIDLLGYPAIPFVRDNSGTSGNGGKWACNFGQRPFAYTPPTGFLPLHTGNLPDSAIVDGSQYFNTTLYTGTGTSQSITGVGFQPDWLWTKARSVVQNHGLVDAVRGSSQRLYSDLTNAEDVFSGITSFDSDGFTVDGLRGTSGTSGVNYVAWNWKANGAGVSNTDGSITSTVSANPTSGFSIVTYTGTGSAATVGHGLGVQPKMVLIKRRDAATNWAVNHVGIWSTGAGVMYLNLTNSSSNDGTFWNNTNPTGTSIYLGSNASVNGSGGTHVAYCFAEVPGFSKFGSYTGNGSADGPFVYTGFRPKFVLIKQTSGLSDWWIWDTARETYNQMSSPLYPNTSLAEASYAAFNFDILSNGFKMRSTNPTVNGSGLNYIFACFAETDFANALAR